MKRCFIYIRVSTQEQAEEGYSLGEQEERLTKYAEAMEWNIEHIYKDGGFSGGNMERPALKQMIEAIERGKTDIVLVDKLDRLSRSQYDTLYLIKKVFNEHGVAFVSRAEAFDTSSSFGRAMVGILAVFAELERERIKERMADGRQGRIKEGKYKGGNSVSLGYDYDPELGYLVPNEYEKMIVLEIFDLIAKRIAFSTIATRLNKKGYRTKKGREFCGTTIRQMADNQTYIGRMNVKGEWVDALHEGIVPNDLFERVQEIMKERSRNYEHFKPCRKYTAPLSGLMYCGKCGAKYHYRKTNTSEARYMCYSRSKSDKSLIKDPNCKNTIYKAKEIEEAIYGEVLKLEGEPLYADELDGSVDVTEEIDIVTDKIKAVDNQITKLVDLYSLGSINIETIKTKTEELTRERDSLSNTLDRLKKAHKHIDREGVIYFSDIFNKALVKNNSKLMNSVLKDLIDYIIIDDDVVEIHWKF